MIKPTKPTPFFTSESSPQFEDGNQLVLPHSYAAYANYRLTSHLGFLPAKEASASFSAGEIQELGYQIKTLPVSRLLQALRVLTPDARGELTRTVEGELRQATGQAVSLSAGHLSSPLLISRDSAFYAVAGSGEMLFRINSGKDGNAGKLEPAGWSTTGMRDGHAETPQECAVRSIEEKIGLHPDSVTDLGYITRKKFAQFVPVEQEAGRAPGLMTGIDFIGFKKFQVDLSALARNIKAGPETLGFVVVDQKQLVRLADDKPVWLRFLSSQGLAAQTVIVEARAIADRDGGVLSIEGLEKYASNANTVLANREDGPSKIERPVKADNLFATRGDFLGGYDHLAVGLQVFQKLGVRLQKPETVYIEEQSPVDQLSATLRETPFRKAVPGVPTLK